MPLTPATGRFAVVSRGMSIALALPVPYTSRVAAVVEVPIPIFPLESTRNRSTPFCCNMINPAPLAVFRAIFDETLVRYPAPASVKPVPRTDPLTSRDVMGEATPIPTLPAAFT